MKILNIAIAVLTLNLIVLHYKNSKTKNNISNLKISMIKQQQILNQQKIILSNLSHPERLTRSSQVLTNYGPTNVRQFIKIT